MELWQLYLITVMPGYFSIAAAITLVGGVGLSILWIIQNIIIRTEGVELRDNPDYGPLKRQIEKATIISKMVKWPAMILLCIGLILAAFPKASQMNMIVGGYYVTNLENINKLPPNILKAANKYLEKINGEK